MSKLKNMETADEEQYKRFFIDCRSNKAHSIDIASLRERCFNIINVFYAHDNILRHKRPAEPDKYCIQQEWHRNLHDYVSSYLLDLAIGIRSLEDKLGTCCPDLTKEDNEYFWVEAGSIKTKTLRKACNKIIHAESFTYALSKLDQDSISEISDEDEYYPQPTRCLSGELEISGKEHGKEWFVSIYVPEFVSTALKFLFLCDKIK